MIRLSELAPDVQASVRATRERVARLHAELPANGLVVWTAGNVSERVPGADLFAIKPSGVRYDELAADNMVVCTLDGEKIDDGTPAALTPSSDTAAHAYGIVETLRDSRSPAVLMANHGPFTIGKDAQAAVKAAVMVEEVARTVAMAQLLGDPVPVAQGAIDSLYARYQNVYGQH